MSQEKHIGLEIKVIANLIKRKIDASAVYSGFEKMTGTHGWIIGYLYKNRNSGDMFQRDLENKFMIRRSTATGILNLMEDNGLIVREPVNYDARLKKLVLTQKAVLMHEKVMHEIEEIESQMIKELTDEEVESFFRITEKIKSNLS
jgi:DNA-binding MarR family transcriptional regulator